MSKYFYSLINNAQDLKTLHDEAVLNGKLEVGLSRGKLLYAWDEERNTIRAIKQDEAAARLGLTVKQIDQIIGSNAEVVFDEPEIIQVETEAVFQEEAVQVVDQPGNEPEAEEIEAVEEPENEPAEELPTVETVDVPESVQDESKAESLTKTALIALADSIIETLEEFKAFIK
jgi:hypothetical protein